MPPLAANLMKQSEQLSAAGDQAGALAASRKATEINRLLLRVSTDHFPPHLAANLHELSARLSEAGDSVGALAAIREAIEIRRRLAKDGGDYAASLEQSLQLLARIETAERPALPGTADRGQHGPLDRPYDLGFRVPVRVRCPRPPHGGRRGHRVAGISSSRASAFPHLLV